MSPADNPNIHRHLDEAFAGIAMAPETQDLKEELRGSLAARALELQEQGADAATAAARAVAELGDIRDLISSLDSGATTGNPSDAVALNRVRVSPAFVVRTTILSIVLAAAATLVALGALGTLGWPLDLLVTIASVGVALPLSIVVADALRQETSQHYPMQTGRARGFGLAALASALGIALCGLALNEALWLFVPGGVFAAAALVGFIVLGISQTNRTKPWALQMQRDYEVGDRFAHDPAAAARFGMYTVVIWIIALGAFVALSIAVGFAWSWLAILGGLVVFFLTLTRMLFAAEPKGK